MCFGNALFYNDEASLRLKEVREDIWKGASLKLNDRRLLKK